nr:hypothetical protein BaRGS_021563 [Batillaria attramentaria]
MAEYVGEVFHPVVTAIFLLVGFAELLSGVLGNGLLLVVLGRYRPLWQAHNVFIASLALADLIIVCVALPSTLMDLVLGYYPVANEAHCRANGFMINAGFYISLMSLVGISFNRYMRFAVVAVADNVPAEVVEAASILLAANSTVNWIIYGAMNTSYRQAYTHTLSCCKRCARSG